MLPLLLAAIGSQPASSPMLVQDFEGKSYHASYAVSSDAKPPTARDGVMSLLHEATSAKAGIGFSRTAKGAFSKVSAQ